MVTDFFVQAVQEGLKCQKKLSKACCPGQILGRNFDFFCITGSFFLHFLQFWFFVPSLTPGQAQGSLFGGLVSQQFFTHAERRPGGGGGRVGGMGSPSILRLVVGDPHPPPGLTDSKNDENYLSVAHSRK